MSTVHFNDAIEIVRYLQGLVRRAVDEGVRPEHVVGYRSMMEWPGLKNSRHFLEQYADDIYMLQRDLDTDLAAHRKDCLDKHLVLATAATAAICTGLSAVVMRLTDAENAATMLASSALIGAATEYVAGPLRIGIAICERNAIVSKYSETYTTLTCDVVEILSRKLLL